MRLEELKEKYPINNTIVGTYWCEDVFFDDEDDRKEILKWAKESLDSGFSFIVTDVNRFACYIYSGWYVSGYYVPQNENKCMLVTFSEAFGYELFDPTDDNYDEVIIVNPTKEKVAKMFVDKSERYFLTYDEIKEYFDK